ncbi:thiaminase II [Tenacibaculum sp. IB213877]|uniref:thiaminase II n=1 Tax=Tenacibaculum sp. IB213877 TaxID=3097351 RepID=UPI002A5A5129|nr:thiaminase II [Tenacibaculum sp. IB213877]MDY0781441.1 thiaminase II [Tenacibaculum sp. IB213877]
MQNWYKKINNQTDYILRKIKEHPFINELMDGTLPKDVFHFYINQDALYLSEYKKILSVTGVKCSDEADTQFFLDAATGVIHVENALHNLFLKQETFNPVPSPTCELYTSYLSRIVHTHSVEESLAAILPCFTIYKQVGDYILKHQTNTIKNPYQNWINTYGGEDFAKSVQKAVEITNKHAQTASDEILTKMEMIFEKASKLEWMFWDSAYNKESWKL